MRKLINILWQRRETTLMAAAMLLLLAGRSVMDKFIAIIFPISAFVAAGFEHSIANMYFIPLSMMLQGPEATIGWGGFFHKPGACHSRQPNRW